ncbi:hypothetical protein [Mesorhizobium sp. M1D.F.Ca.ET.043.01.1.1]|uniref:hypothetical protein n=1 Tax=Mesorhizobium sp. M1D.F.Ca.ET.043.01.1.1 TaxID=2493669 RepID=UPI000F75B094|nr:hypothetical protein [Mesorhizobium sp. M1D.F.Ca.ET.043.01.1.1]AZO69986.1 hypothetical protein EJ067_01380 [Mesorhizobium sp. M1D.F.Ca.ET.043.01.1.1]
MDWRTNLIANHKAEIARLREEIRQEQENPGEIGSTMPDGTRVSLSDEIIADNLRMIATLEAIIARAEAGD